MEAIAFCWLHEVSGLFILLSSIASNTRLYECIVKLTLTSRGDYSQLKSQGEVLCDKLKSPLSVIHRVLTMSCNWPLAIVT